SRVLSLSHNKAPQRTEIQVDLGRNKVPPNSTAGRVAVLRIDHLLFNGLPLTTGDESPHVILLAGYGGGREHRCSRRPC
ncbi:MAG TPA: hypothetical protein P5307_17340, partial [Pirellulaceae bacterium]|nr:hypothetical protein [Pirellulaceae bacterium]